MHGGRFVVYRYCFSIVILTFRRTSSVRFMRFDQSRLRPGLPYTLLSLVAGWWGIPWGPIFTIEAVRTNLKGGTDVTAAVVAAGTRPTLAASGTAPGGVDWQ
jgi:hypothetical protein